MRCKDFCRHFLVEFFCRCTLTRRNDVLKLKLAMLAMVAMLSLGACASPEDQGDNSRGQDRGSHRH